MYIVYTVYYYTEHCTLCTVQYAVILKILECVVCGGEEGRSCIAYFKVTLKADVVWRRAASGGSVLQTGK